MFIYSYHYASCMQEEVTISSKGQVTIPKPFREKFGLEEGTKVVFMQENNEIVLFPKYKNPLKRMMELRQQLRFTEKDIQEMISDSKNAWSKIE